MTNFKVLFFSLSFCLVLFSSCSKVEQKSVVNLPSEEIELRSPEGNCICVASITNVSFDDYVWAVDINFINPNGGTSQVSLDTDNLSAGFNTSGSFEADITGIIGGPVGTSASLRIALNCNGDSFNEYSRTFSCNQQSCNEVYYYNVDPDDDCLLYEAG